MKIFTTLFLFLISSIYTQAQVDFEWARRGASTTNDALYSSVTDAMGNTYMTGSFGTNNLIFGTDTLFGTLLNDFYLVKYNASGDVIWARSAGGPGVDYGTDVDIDALGNVYVCGLFTQSGISFGNDTLTSAANLSNDIFVAKYDSSGNALNAFSIGGISDDTPFGIAIDASGYCFVTGLYFSPSIDFGPVTITNSNSIGDVFVAKYDPTGNCLWVQTAQEASGLSIDVSANSEAVITGRFAGNLVPFGNDTLSSAGANDFYIARLDNSGNFIWADCAGGTGDESGERVAVDIYGNSYVTGFFKGSGITFGTISLNNSGSSFTYGDMFLVKYDPAGNVIWARRAGSFESEEGSGLRTDADGNVYVSGTMGSASVFIGTTQLTSYGFNDAFVAKYDTSGNALWALNGGGGSSDYSYGLGIDNSGNAYLAGHYNSDPAVFGNTLLSNSGPHDIFIAKINNSLSMPEAESTVSEILVYPVPAENELLVVSQIQLKTISLFSLTGQVITKSELHSVESSIDITKLAQGIYFLQIETEKDIYTRKVIKQ